MNGILKRWFLLWGYWSLVYVWFVGLFWFTLRMDYDFVFLPHLYQYSMTVPHVLFHVADFYVAWILFGGVLFTRFFNGRIQKLFAWRWLKYPLTGSISITLFNLVFENKELFWRGCDMDLYGVNWQWQAFLVYLTLFTVLFYRFQKNGVSNYAAFAVSFFSVCLASILYELPWHLANDMTFMFSPKFFVSLPCLVSFLISQKWKPNMLFMLALFPLAYELITFSLLPFYLPRILVCPLFLSFTFLPKRMTVNAIQEQGWTQHN